MARSLVKILSGAAVAAAALVAVWVSRRRQNNASAAQLGEVEAAARTGDDTPPGPRPDELPAPVDRYLRWALQGNKSIRIARIRQVGVLRTSVFSQRWMKFEAVHTVAPAARAFLWDARVFAAPGAWIRVLDSLIDGTGSGRVSLFSAIELAADASRPEINSGSLHRFLAEAPFYPSALLPTRELRWTAAGKQKAVATLTDHDATVSVEFSFADTGEVTGMFAPARWCKFRDGYRQLPWEGHFRDYQRVSGLWIPTEAEVGWHMETGFQIVWIGRIVRFDWETYPASQLE